MANLYKMLRHFKCLSVLLLLAHEGNCFHRTVPWNHRRRSSVECLRKPETRRHMTRIPCLSSDRKQDDKSKTGRLVKEKPAERFFTMRWKPIADDTRDDLRTVFASFFFLIFMQILMIEPRFIPSLSMFPTFDIGDQLLVDKISHINHRYSRRDVVVFDPSENYVDMTGNTQALIKRVVAIAGDTVEIKNCKLFVNGLEQTEPYVNEVADYVLTPQVVPAGMLMMLGDNRNHSFDSHIWGFLPEKNVIGRAVVKYWPPSRIGFIEGST